ncbi:MAG: phosphoribosylaminoimidazolesuccinocarboxamide synthase [Acidobacteriaceae bacterium]|nr:phosphoribosylaminoimidazolesuccinocarboxamide synthase [Acidobacteriaceae bacterium]
MCRDRAVLATNLPLPLVARGKVRDLYDLGDSLLFVASDRISAFDNVLPTGIPCKGRVLTQMSLFWFEFLKDLVPNHLLSAEPPRRLSADDGQTRLLEGRSMVVKKAEMVPIECVARGYLAGSAWKEYQQAQAVCGIPLPPGLRESERLPLPIFTPAAKSHTGHDINLSFDELATRVGLDLAGRLRDLTLRVYERAAAHSLSRGIILADTKFEFGFVGQDLLLADEVLTPDSSRYWPADEYEPGRPQSSFDKQYVRDYLDTLDWDKMPPAPGLPEMVAQKTSEKYQEAYTRLTGRDLFATSSASAIA